MGSIVKQTVYSIKIIILTTKSFRCSRVVGPDKDFVAIWIPVGLSSGLSPWCDPLTLVLLCEHERDCHLIDLSMADSLFHRSFFSCKDNTLNV